MTWDRPWQKLPKVWCNWPMFTFLNRRPAGEVITTLPSCALCTGVPAFNRLLTPNPAAWLTLSPCAKGGGSPAPQWTGDLWRSAPPSQCHWHMVQPLSGGLKRLLDWHVDRVRITNGNNQAAYGRSLLQPFWLCQIEAHCTGGERKTLFAGRKDSGGPDGVYMRDDTVAEYPLRDFIPVSMTFTGATP